MIALARPEALALLVLVAATPWSRRRRRPAALGLPELAPALAAGRPRLAALPACCRILGLSLIVLALAGPYLPRQALRLSGLGADVMLCIDLSESMAAMDVRQKDRTATRLAAVVEAAGRFAAERPGDRIGLVAFGSRAYAVIPPTRDRAALAQALDRLEVGAAGRRTAMGDALGLAVRHLADAPGRSRLAVVLGDGGSNTGEISPETAARAAADRGVRVFTVGVGGDAPAAFLVNHPLLGRQIVHERAPIDAESLGVMARIGGGAFFRAETAEDLERAMRGVDGMEPSDVVAEPSPDDLPLAPVAAAAAACCLTAFAGLRATRFLRLP